MVESTHPHPHRIQICSAPDIPGSLHLSFDILNVLSGSGWGRQRVDGICRVLRQRYLKAAWFRPGPPLGAWREASEVPAQERPSDFVWRGQPARPSGTFLVWGREFWAGHSEEGSPPGRSSES